MNRHFFSVGLFLVVMMGCGQNSHSEISDNPVRTVPESSFRTGARPETGIVVGPQAPYSFQTLQASQLQSLITPNANRGANYTIFAIGKFTSRGYTVPEELVHHIAVQFHPSNTVAAYKIHAAITSDAPVTTEAAIEIQQVFVTEPPVSMEAVAQATYEAMVATSGQEDPSLQKDLMNAPQ